MVNTLYWKALCGSDAEWVFWSNNMTMDTNYPRLSSCFQNSALPWFAQGLFLLCVPFHIASLVKRRTRERATIGFLSVVKLILCLGLVGVAIANLVHVVQESNSTFKPKILFIAPSIDIFVMLVMMAVIILERYKNEQSSIVVFIFWTLWLLVETLKLISWIENRKLSEKTDSSFSEFLYITIIVGFCISVLQWLLHCFADPGGEKRIATGERQPLLISQSDDEAASHPSPETKASALSRICFMWITGLVLRGYRKPLIADDLWDLAEENKSKVISDVVVEAWQRREAQLPPLQEEEEPEEPEVPPSSSDEVPVARVVQPKKRKTRISFFGVLRETFGLSFAGGAFFKLISDMLSFAQPQLLSLMIAFINAGSSAYVWHGYFLAVMLFAVAELKTFLLQQYFHLCYSTGMRIRSAVIGIIYRKALRLSGSSRGETTVGEVVNLMSVDAQRLQDVPIFLHNIWSAPMQMILAIVFLWLELGPSVLAGVGVMVLLTPLNGFITSKMRALQMRQMRLKDERIKVTNEVLNGIKVLKLYSWEAAFREKIECLREKETKMLRKVAYMSSVGSISWFCAPFLVALVTFAVYVSSSPFHILDARKAFVSLSLFNILQFPMSMLPGVISMIVQTSVSIKRINVFLEGDELDPDATERLSAFSGTPDDDAISVENGSFSWGKKEASFLQNVNLNVQQGQLVAVVGEVGSGKSSLVHAILGEMHKRSGHVRVKGDIAYVAQQAWCQNASLRDNILFGSRMSICKYDAILDACALRPDLQVLAAGDDTEIGEKGINLSGGQKQRVSLARALYSDASVYLLDDPLSAVDSHVGRHIFDEVISREKGILRNKTCLLVTHAISFLPRCDQIIVMQDGRVQAVGTYTELLAEDGPFAAFLREYLKDDEGDEEEQVEAEGGEESAQEPQDRAFKRQLRRTVSTLGSCDRRRGSRRLSRESSSAMSDEAEPGNKQAQPGSTLIEAEGMNVGTVKWSVFKAYLQSASWLVVFFVILTYWCYIGLRVFNSIWLSIWSTSNVTNPDGSQDYGKTDFYLGVYGGLAGGLTVVVAIQSFMITIASYRASRELHRLVLLNILRAPMLFFDTTPIGRIINRFSKDIDTVDMNIPQTTRIWTNTFASVITTVIIVSYASPFFLVALIPISIFYYLVQRFYVSTSRQLKRIDSVKRSPIYSHFQETIVGATTIRSFGKGQSFVEKSDLLVDANQAAYYPNIVSYRWLGTFLESIGNIVILMSAVLAVVERHSMGAGLAGLSISYALQITSALNFMVRMSTDMETYIVSVERIKEYSEIDTEAATVTDVRPPEEWPEAGEVVFRDYSVRYRDDLDLVLRGINIRVEPGQRVGLVGRTGAGKSSLTLALFRILEPASGTIYIDGIDITDLGLSDLRSRLTIIPQDPVLFSGPLRLNLDPQAQADDDALWLALEQAGLKRFVASQAAGLDMVCAEGGDNLSVGQRQLVCLARALLRRTRLLILDEATAAVDLATDDLIQETIRKQFEACTIITIAHRLNTVIDYDKIVVLDKGSVKEVDSPQNLLADPSTTFYSMARDAKLVNVLPQ